MAEYSLTIDFPLSTNTYYTVYRGRKILSAKAREYKKLVSKQIIQQLGKKIKPLTGRLEIVLQFSRYDRRTYDVANYEKIVTDCLSGVLIVDDCQFDDIRLQRLPVSSSGYCNVFVKQLSKSTTGRKAVNKKKSVPLKRKCNTRKKHRVKKPTKKHSSDSIYNRLNSSGCRQLR